MNSLKIKGTVIAVMLALLVTMLPCSSLAYLIDTSGPIDNRMIFPSLEIELTETLWNAAEEHLLVPSRVYDKNPVTTLKSGSVASYVFMEVIATPELRAVLTEKTETDGDMTLYYYPAVNPAWEKIGSLSTDEKSVYKYVGNLATFDGQCSADIPLPALFDRIQVKTDATNTQIEAAVTAAGAAPTVDITVKSYAVQQAGFGTAEAAYAAAYGN